MSLKKHSLACQKLHRVEGNSGSFGLSSFLYFFIFKSIIFVLIEYIPAFLYTLCIVVFLKIDS
jgi:hypothetical protein